MLRRLFLAMCVFAPFAQVFCFMVRAQGHGDPNASTGRITYQDAPGGWCKIEVVVAGKDSNLPLSADEIRVNNKKANDYSPESLWQGRAMFPGEDGRTYSLVVEKQGYITYQGNVVVHGDTKVDVHLKSRYEGARLVEALLNAAYSGNRGCYEEIARMNGAAVPLLASKMTERDLKLAATAAVVLARIGEPAVPRLIEALSHSTKQVKELAISALAQIGEKAAHPLAKSLDSDEEEIRFYAAVTLCRIGQPTLPHAERIVGDPNTTNRTRELAQLIIEAIRRPERQVRVPYDVPKAFLITSRPVKITVEDRTGKVQSRTFSVPPGTKGSVPFKVTVPARAREYVRGQFVKEYILWSEEDLYETTNENES